MLSIILLLMIEIRKDIYEQMIQEAVSSFPSECCGILAGKNKSATKIYPVKNIDSSPQSCYLMEPNIQFRILKTLDQISFEMVAIYHSHPNDECYPSAKDIELANYNDTLYIIISLADFEYPEVKAFEIKDGNVKEEKIKVV